MKRHVWLAHLFGHPFQTSHRNDKVKEQRQNKTTTFQNTKLIGKILGTEQLATLFYAVLLFNMTSFSWKHFVYSIVMCSFEIASPPRFALQNNKHLAIREYIVVKVESTKWNTQLASFSYRMALSYQICLSNRMSNQHNFQIQTIGCQIHFDLIFFTVQFISQHCHYAHSAHINADLRQYLFVYLWNWTMFIQRIMFKCVFPKIFKTNNIMQTVPKLT